MTVRTLRSDLRRKSLALLTSVVLLSGAVPSVFAQAETGAVTGVILNPDGVPAYGFKVILRDTASNKTFISDPTDAEGNYSLRVPVGGRYQVDSVIADDGVSKLRVQDVAPINVLAEGTTRLNVRFTSTALPGEQPAGAESAGNQKKKGAVPWYRRPGPIVGIVLGSAAVAALALSGGGDDNPPPASPSGPGPF